MRALLLVVGLVLLGGGLILGVAATPLSGWTILAGLLILAGGYLVISLTAPPCTVTIDEACDLLVAERHR